VSYDRIFETRNLTSEMISGKKELLTLRDFAARTISLKQDYLGEIYVKFLEPLVVSDFLK
jgi:glycerol-3-phosphate O-acyltransferase